MVSLFRNAPEKPPEHGKPRGGGSGYDAADLQVPVRMTVLLEHPADRMFVEVLAAVDHPPQRFVLRFFFPYGVPDTANDDGGDEAPECERSQSCT
jgi:hypothetical protein